MHHVPVTPRNAEHDGERGEAEGRQGAFGRSPAVVPDIAKADLEFNDSTLDPVIIRKAKKWDAAPAKSDDDRTDFLDIFYEIQSAS